MLLYIMDFAIHTHMCVRLYTYKIYICIYMPWAPQTYMFRCFMVNSLDFRWPIPLISFHGWKGAHVFFHVPFVHVAMFHLGNEPMEHLDF